MKVSALLPSSTLFAVLLWTCVTTTLFPRSLHAAIIPVDTTIPGVVADGECSLAEAIIAANTNSATNGCPAGDDSPTDTILLGENATYFLASSHDNSDSSGPTGLPRITSNIIISGNNGVIQRIGSEEFRLLHVTATTGHLALHEVILRNGYAITDVLTAAGGQGGAILNEGEACR
jgi:hypothetical protein